MTSTEVFDEHLSAWRSWQRSPWGRLRYAVVADLLGRHLGDLGPGSTVVDVGGADGLDSAPFAAAGADVLVVDPSAAMLADAGARPGVRTAVLSVDELPGRWPALVPGGADAVLCHNVVQYCADLDATLAAAISPLLRLVPIATNPVIHVLTTAARDLDPDAALTMLDSPVRHGQVFDHDMQRIPVDVAARALEDAGCDVVAHYGVLCVNHLITADERKHDPQLAAWCSLERLELAVADRSPYRNMRGNVDARGPPSMTPLRSAVLGQVAGLVEQRRRPGSVLRVGIDGVDGAGKTVLGDELAEVLTARRVPVIRASVDGFHHPSVVRYRQGRSSPQGFYEDSYDYEALHRELLHPLARNGSGRYRTAVFDVAADAPVAVPHREAAGDEVLVLDGIFLHRPESCAAPSTSPCSCGCRSRRPCRAGPHATAATPTRRPR